VRCRAVRGMVGLVSDELGGACAPRRVCGGPGRVALGAAVSPEKTFFFNSRHAKVSSRGEEGGRSGGSRPAAGAARTPRETCPAGASGRWQRMRSASPGLSSTRTRGLSVVDRGTQTSRGGEFRRNNLLHVTACGSCRAVARREDVTASHGWLWACRDNKETLV
jgi:hypothetical protein